MLTGLIDSLSFRAKLVFLYHPHRPMPLQKKRKSDKIWINSEKSSKLLALLPLMKILIGSTKRNPRNMSKVSSHVKKSIFKTYTPVQKTEVLSFYIKCSNSTRTTASVQKRLLLIHTSMISGYLSKKFLTHLR